MNQTCTDLFADDYQDQWIGPHTFNPFALVTVLHLHPVTAMLFVYLWETGEIAFPACFLDDQEVENPINSILLDPLAGALGILIAVLLRVIRRPGTNPTVECHLRSLLEFVGVGIGIFLPNLVHWFMTNDDVDPSSHEKRRRVAAQWIYAATSAFAWVVVLTQRNAEWYSAIWCRQRPQTTLAHPFNARMWSESFLAVAYITLGTALHTGVPWNPHLTNIVYHGVLVMVCGVVLFRSQQRSRHEAAITDVKRVSLKRRFATLREASHTINLGGR